MTLEKENIFHRQTKQSELCLPLSWDFNPNIQKRVLPTFFPPLLFFFFREIYLRHAVAQGHQKTRRSEAMDKRQQQQKNKTKWGKTSFFKKKEKKTQATCCHRAFVLLRKGAEDLPLKSARTHTHTSFSSRGRWLAGRMDSSACHFSPLWPFLWPLKKQTKERLNWTLVGHICKFKSLQEFSVQVQM